MFKNITTNVIFLYLLCFLTSCSMFTDSAIKQHKEYYDNGKIEHQYSYYLNGSGEKIMHGTEERWYENGEKRSRSNYKHGKNEGLYRYWHDNGILAYECKYINGERKRME